MPYALYTPATGIITAVYYTQPTNAAQLVAFTAQGLAIIEVPEGVNSANSFIDPNTGKAAPTGPAVVYCYRYRYDPVTGIIDLAMHGNILGTVIPESTAGMLFSATDLSLDAATILTIDANGMPVKDDNGNYTTSPLPVVPQPPDLGALLIIGLVKLGGIDPAIIPAPLLSAVNASLATVNAPAISG